MSLFNSDSGKKFDYFYPDELRVRLPLFRSVSPYVPKSSTTYGNQSPQRHNSRSPRPFSRQKAEIRLTVEPPSSPTFCFHRMPSVEHDSRPNIAAWPAPPTDPTNLLSASTKSTQRLTAGSIDHSTTIFSSSGGSSGNIKSLSPAANSIAAAVAAVAAANAATSPYPSPQPSPISFRAESNSDFAEDSAKLLSMLKTVVSFNSGVPRGQESELRQKIQALEETVAEYERQKYNVMGTFTEYRERVAERERKLEAEYSNRIIALSEEVLGAKKDFETRMKSFQTLQEQFEREKEQALEKLRQEHQKEIQVLEQRFSESQLLNLEQKYLIEIQRLEEERKSLKMEKERLGETFEMKLKRTQSLYETELTAAKMLYMRELEMLRDHEKALKEELAARQEEFHDRLLEIQHQAKASKDEMNNCKNEVALLERKLRKKEAEVQDISKQLLLARNETNAELKKLNEAKSDLEEIRKEYTQQKSELERKSKLLSTAETARTKLEATIRELQTEVKTLRNKVDFLEMERENLQGQSENETHLHNTQVKALEAVLESVTKEKETTKEHYEKLLEQEREQAEEREYSIKKEFSTKLNELEDQYNALREHIEQSDSFGPENVCLWEEIESLRSEKGVLEDEVYRLRSQLSNNEIIQGSQSGDMAPEDIFELLKIIDIVKRKVSLHTGNNNGASSRASDIYTDDLLPQNQIVENAKIVAGTSATDNISIDCQKSESTKTENDSISSNNLPLSNGIQLPNFDLATILEKIKELELSLDEIIVEKNDACVKVEQLGEENRILVEKFENFQTIHNNGDSLELLRTQKSLEEHKRKIVELEESSNIAKKEFETRLEEERALLEAEMQQKFNEKNEMLVSQVKDLETKLTHQIDAKLLHETEQKLHSIQEDKCELENKLDDKTNEFEAYKQIMKEQLRQQDEEHSLMVENKIGTLNIEHEKTIELIRQHEMELKEQIHQLQAALAAQSKNKNDKLLVDQCEDQTQTEVVDGEELTVIASTDFDELNDQLQRQVELLKYENKDKCEQINQLQQQIICHGERFDEAIQCDSIPSSPNEDFKGQNELNWISENARKDRSQSMVAGSKHMAMCQKAANRFQNLVSQITEKKKVTGLRPPTDICVSKSKMYYKERQLQKDSSNSPPAMTSLSGWSETARNKSPSLSRERSPCKLKYDAVAPEQLTSISGACTGRSLLSPSEAEIRRRVSPSRQFLFSKNSEKRPAWKF